MSRVTQTAREWVRDTDRRVQRAETPTTVRVGSWSLWEDRNGDLVAGRDGRTRVVATLSEGTA